jgi:DNA-binding NtrC family response regulator
MRLERFLRECFSRLRVFFAPKQPPCPSPEPLASPNPPEERITVLVLSYSQPAHQVFERVAQQEGWRLLWSESWREAVRLIEDRTTGVVILDRNLLGADWRDALQMLLQPAHRCCVLLLTTGERDRFCEEFLEDGGCQILFLPLQESALREAVPSAWAFWKGCIRRVYHYS